jgi:hypothetical protein
MESDEIPLAIGNNSTTRIIDSLSHKQKTSPPDNYRDGRVSQ